MTFADLGAGASVFVDANTLIYHCTLDPVFGSACTGLLDRIGRGEIVAFTSAHVLLEVAHRLMTLEAARQLGKPAGSMVKFLKSHLDEIHRLTSFRQAIEDLCIGQLQILAMTPAMVPTIVALSQQIGLLTNDAAVVAIMQASGLSKSPSCKPADCPRSQATIPTSTACQGLHVTRPRRACFMRITLSFSHVTLPAYHPALAGNRPAGAAPGNRCRSSGWPRHANHWPRPGAKARWPCSCKNRAAGSGP